MGGNEVLEYRDGMGVTDTGRITTVEMLWIDIS